MPEERSEVPEEGGREGGGDTKVRGGFKGEAKWKEWCALKSSPSSCPANSSKL